MENLYKYIENHVKEHGYKNITDFCKATKISRATMSELKAGRTKQLSPKTAGIISSVLGIPMNTLLGLDEYDPIVFCRDCGLRYDSSSEKQVKTHEKRHSNWKKAVDKFGFCWNGEYREEIKGKARENADSLQSLSDKIDAQIIVYKSLFSRSLEASGYNLNHADFQTYIAMLLNQGDGHHGVSGDLYNALVNKYGKKEGINSGTYYVVPEVKKQPTQKGELSDNREELIRLAKCIPDEKVSLVLRVVQSLLEGDQ